MPTWDQVWTGLLMLGVAIWGGVVSYYRKVSKGLRHTWTRMAGEIATSAMSGFGVGYICYESGFSFAWSLAFAGVAGHMGSAVFDMGEEILRNTLASLAGRRDGKDRRD